MAGANIELSYESPRPRRRWRRGARAVGLLAALGLMLYLANGDWWLRARLQFSLLAAQRRCMNFAAAPDRVVVEFEPAAAARLLKREGYRSYVQPEDVQYHLTQVDWTGMDDAMQALYNATGPVERYDDAAKITDRRAINAFSDYYNMAGISGYPNVLFLHSMQSASGERLVAVRFDSAIYFRQGMICPLVWKPATYSSPPLWLNASQLAKIHKGDGDLVIYADRIYAGQLDPSDRSRFFIRYEKGTRTGRVVGQLMADDTVKLTDEGVR